MFAYAPPGFPKINVLRAVLLAGGHAEAKR